jgi:hypothetical protein
MMQTEVHMPIRLRLDHAALARPAVLQAAVTRSVARALRRSRALIGDDILAEPLAPRITWRGAADVSATTRRSVEQAVRVGLAAALGAAADSAAEPAALKPPREPLDRRRLHPLGHYIIDSYEGGSVAVPVEEDAPRALPPRWSLNAMVPQRAATLRPYLARQASITGVPIPAGPVVLMFHNDLGWDLMFSADGFNDGTPVLAFNFEHQMMLVPERDGQVLRFREERIMPPPSRAVLTVQLLPTASAERAAALYDIYAPSMRARLQRLYSEAEARDEAVMDNADYEAMLDHAVDAGLAQASAALRPEWRHLIRVDFGDGTAFNVQMPPEVGAALPASGSVPVVPILFTPIVIGSIVGTGFEDAGDGGAGAGTGTSRGGDGPEGSNGNGRGSSANAGGSPFRISGAGSSARGAMFPHLPPSFLHERIACAPFNGTEADPATLGALGDRMLALVAEISTRLGIAPCRHPASFCLIAGGAIANFATATGRFANNEGTGESRMAAPGAGSMGRLHFTPSASPSVQLLRRLAQAATRTAELIRLVGQVHLGEGGDQLAEPYHGRKHAWVIAFLNDARRCLAYAVGRIFTAGCQVVMLQLLATSAQQIAARQRNLRAYAPLFQEIMLARLSDIGDLTSMLERLQRYAVARSVQDVVPPVPGWPQAARALADACVATEGFAHRPGEGADIIEEGGTLRIRDHRGFLWTRQALQTAIAQRRGEAESMDPLIQQLSHIPETIEAFRRDPTAAETLLESLLADMAQKNREQTEKARGDDLFGLQAARIAPSAMSAQVPGAPYALVNTHLLAHQLLGEFFNGDHIWGDGIRDALMNEEAKTRFIHVFEFVGLVMLAVLCPPAAFVAGVAIAVVEVVHAHARLDLYRGLINPELVLNRAELELELYIAYAGLALSLLPEATTAVRAASIGVRGGLRRGAGAGIRLAGRSLLRHASRQTTTALSRELLPALVREAATNLVMQHVIEIALGPVLERVQRQLAIHTAQGGIAGAEALIRAIEHDAGRRAEAPLPPGLAAEDG